MKPNHTLKTAGLLACTFLATAGFIAAQEAAPAKAPADLEARRAAAMKKAEQIREELMKAAKAPRPQLTAEQKEAAKQAEAVTKAAREAELAPKLAAGLDTAAKQRPANEKSDWLTEKQQVEGLRDFAVRFKEESEREHAAAKARAAGSELERLLLNDGKFGLKRFDENGLPVLIQSNAIAGADSISTDEVWPGGTSTVPDLNGIGAWIGVWEYGGTPRSTHAEIDYRLSTGSGLGIPLFDTTHATQVGGVLIGRGVLASAKGMSYDDSAELLAQDSDADISEMAAMAASGLKLSNHSYGQSNGWVFNSTLMFSQWVWNGADVAGEDARFGFYNVDSRQVDITAYDAPGYLPVWAAGNDNGETGPNAGEAYWLASTGAYGSTTTHPADNGSAGFDTLPAYAASKNALVVGAVNPVAGGYSGSGSVNIASFSSRGPTDDGRIKPDLVADGVDVIAPTFELVRPINVPSFSFEEANIPAPSGTGVAAPGWTVVPGTPNGGFGNAYRLQFSGGQNFAGFGTHVLGVAGINTVVYQDLPGVTILAGKTYTVTLRLGKYPNAGVTDPASIYRVKIYTNGFANLARSVTFSASSFTDSFKEHSFTFTLASPPAGNLRIALEHGGPTFAASGGGVNYLFFDAVQLSYDHGSVVNTYTDGSAYGLEKVQGTSFAAPAVTGSANLLHELNGLRSGKNLWASTIKTLLIATADDAGNAGPDYTYGWGLQNTKKAAEHLDRQLQLNRHQRMPSLIRQHVLYDGLQPEIKVKAKGGEDLVVTLGYTDPAYQNTTVAAANGGIPANTLDPALSMLVNDVDVEIIRPDNVVIGPWLLNPASPSTAATAPATGNDDDRNNVKQVRIPAASVVAGGIYTIRVKQDGVLRTAKKVPNTTNYELVTSTTGAPAFQRFSLVLRGNVERQEDVFEMTEMVRSGTNHYLQWRSVKGLRYRLEMSTDLINWTEVAGDIDATGETTSLTRTGQSTTEPMRFYRVKEVGT